MVLIKVFLRSCIIGLDKSAVVWRYTSPIKGEVVDVRIAHRYIVFARSSLRARAVERSPRQCSSLASQRQVVSKPTQRP